MQYDCLCHNFSLWTITGTAFNYNKSQPIWQNANQFDPGLIIKNEQKIYMTESKQRQPMDFRFQTWNMRKECGASGLVICKRSILL